MAQDLDDGEFWLPSQFLTDDDILMDFKSDLVVVGGGSKNRVNTVSGFGFFGPYSSGHSSPVESVVSSTETESDEEYYIAGLTQKLAHSTLQDDLCKEDSASVYESQKPVATAGSPQSTLCGVLGGCGCKQGSSRGSPNCPSPQNTELNRNDSAWDLLYAAAGEVARMRMVEDTNINSHSNTNNNGFYQNRGGLLAPPRKPSPVSVPPKNPIPNQNISYQQIQLAQFQQLKQQQMMKQQAIWTQSKAASGNYHHQQQGQTQQVVGQNRARNNNGRPLGLSPAAWPTLQQSQQQQPPPGSGMRAVFLGLNNGSKRECAGTGVFLPRGVGGQTETRKKPGCATVLLPDRVVQALNLNLEAMDSHQTQIQPRFKPNFTPDHDAALKYRNNAFMPQQKRNLRTPAGISQDHRLPPEWTY